MYTKVVNVLSTSGTQDITFTPNAGDPSWTPKVAIVQWNRAVASTSAWIEHMSYGIGFTDGTNSRCVTVASEDNQARADTGTFASNDALIRAQTPTGTLPGVDAVATFTSWLSNGMQITWTDAPGAAFYMTVMFLGGSDITNVSVGSLLSTTTTGDKSVTSLAWQPDFGMFISGSTVTENTGTANGGLSVGAATSSSAQWVQTIFELDNPVTMDTGQYYSHGKVWARQTAAGTIDGYATFSSFNSNGFTINVGDAVAASIPIYYLVMKGGTYSVGNATEPGGTGNQTITTSNDVKAVAMFGLDTGTADAAQANLMWSGGFCDNLLNQFGHVFEVKDNVADSVVVSALDGASHIYNNITGNATAGSTTWDDSALVNSVSATNFIVNWDNIGQARPFRYITFGTGISIYPVPISETAVTVDQSLATQGFYFRPISEPSVSISDDLETLYESASQIYSVHCVEFPETISESVEIFTEAITPFSATKTHKYDIAQQVSTTKTHKFDTLSLVPTTTKTHKYHTLALVTTTKTHKYDTLELVETTKTHKYNTIVLVEATKTHKWDTIAPIATTTTKTHKFDTIVSISTTTKTHKFDTITAIGATTKTHKHNVLGFVTTTKTHKWHTLASAATTKTHKWNAIELVTALKTHKFDTESVGVVSTTKTHKYNSIGLVTTTKTHKFDTVTAIATTTKTHKYNVEQGIIQVSTTKTHKFDTLATVSTTKTHKYNTIVAIPATTKTHRYNLVTAVSTTKTHLYNITVAANTTKTHKYDTIRLVTALKTHLYNLGGLVSTTKTHKFDTIHKIPCCEKFHLYNVIAPVEATKTHKWNTIAQVSTTKTHKYNTIGLVSTTKTHKWNTIAQVTTTTKTHKYHLLLAITTTTKTHKYHTVTAIPTTTKTHKYHTVTSLIATKTHKYNKLSDNVTITVTKTHKYNVLEPIAPIPTGGTHVFVTFPDERPQKRILDVISSIDNIARSNVEIYPEILNIATANVEVVRFTTDLVKFAEQVPQNKVRSGQVLPPIIQEIRHKANCRKIGLELIEANPKAIGVNSLLELNIPQPIRLVASTEISKQTKDYRIQSKTEIRNDKIPILLSADVEIRRGSPKIRIAVTEIMPLEKYDTLRTFIEIIKNDILFE